LQEQFVEKNQEQENGRKNLFRAGERVMVEKLLVVRACVPEPVLFEFP